MNTSLQFSQRFLYYDAHGDKYLDLKLPKSYREISDLAEVIDPYEIQWFNLYPYYRYNGWYKDVIKKLESEKEQTDSSLYLLARAYSTFAASLLSDQIGFSIPEECFHPPLKRNSLSQDQIEQYEKVCKRAIQLFKQVGELNPSFETIVGKISVKYANEEMSRFHTLNVFAPDYAKSIKLPDNLYPDSIISQTNPG